jgi:hypothetical protein
MDVPIVPVRNRGGALAAVLLVELAVGYEWLASGLAKIAHGDFPAGLRAALADMSDGAPRWYGSFLARAVEPHATAFGYAIEAAEVAVGCVLVTAALLATRGIRVSPALRAAALAVGLFLAVNFELASGGSFGLRLASDSFDEGVDLDTIMVAAQLALIVPCIAALRTRRG